MDIDRTRMQENFRHKEKSRSSKQTRLKKTRNNGARGTDERNRFKERISWAANHELHEKNRDDKKAGFGQGMVGADSAG
jgi:hypothetical protein